MPVFLPCPHKSLYCLLRLALTVVNSLFRQHVLPLVVFMPFVFLLRALEQIREVCYATHDDEQWLPCSMSCYLLLPRVSACLLEQIVE